jgi:hypothetical protein
MGQCRAVVAGPRELDLAGHGGRREEEEGREAAQRRGAGGSYRPRSSWARGVTSGGGRFGPGRLNGERAERPAARRMAGVAWRLGEVSRTRVRVRRCQGASQVALEGSPGPFGLGRAVDEVHRRRTAGGGETEQAGRREMEIGAFL